MVNGRERKSVSRLLCTATTNSWMRSTSQTSTLPSITCWGNASGGEKLFFHLIDIAAVNGFILFDSIRKADPTKLPRQKKYSVLEFRGEVIRNLAGLNEYDNPPSYKVFTHWDTFHTLHIPQFGDRRNNCIT